jgi:hypothetical protein
MLRNIPRGEHPTFLPPAKHEGPINARDEEALNTSYLDAVLVSSACPSASVGNIPDVDSSTQEDPIVLNPQHEWIRSVFNQGGGAAFLEGTEHPIEQISFT